MFQVDRRPIIDSPGESNQKKRPDFLSTRFFLLLQSDYSAISYIIFIFLIIIDVINIFRKTEENDREEPAEHSSMIINKFGEGALQSSLRLDHLVRVHHVQTF